VSGAETASARLTAGRVYMRRAAERAPDLLAAADDVARAAELAPGLASVRRAAPRLRAWQALSHARAGRHGDALAMWLDLERDRPGDVRTLHALALAALRTGLSRETAPGDAVAAWRTVCGTWAAVLHSPGFWGDLAARTGRVATPEQIRAARVSRIERIDRGLRDRAEDDDTGWAAEYRELERRWGLELEVAARLGRSAAPDAIVCGPLMLSRIAHRGPRAARGFADTIHACADEDTRVLLGPLGLYRYLIDAGRPEDAIEGLTGRPDGAELLVEAQVSWARALERRGEWVRALACLEGCASLPPGATELAGACGVRAARTVLDADPDDHASAVALLERAWALATDHAELRSNLGAAYARSARIANNAEDYREAIRLIRRAREFTPDEPTVSRFAGAAMRNLAIDLLDEDTRESVGEATALAREAFGLHPDEEAREFLRAALFTQARTATMETSPDRASRTRAVAMMTELVALEPGFAGDARSEALRRLGVLLRDAASERGKAEDHRRALFLYKEARRYDDDMPTRRAIAFSHFHLHEYEEAESLLRDEIRLGEDVEALMGSWTVVVSDWAWSHHLAGRTGRGVSVLNAALGRFEDERVRRSLVDLHLEAERGGDAMRAAAKLPRGEENDRLRALTLHNEGVRYGDMNDHHTSLALLRQAYDLCPTPGTAEAMRVVRSRVSDH